MGRFAAEHSPEAVRDYGELWRWSVEDLPSFWGAVWNHFPLDSSTPVDAVLAECQTRGTIRLTLAELRDQVRRVAAGLRRLGVTEGGRVAAYLQNVPEAGAACHEGTGEELR